MNAITYSDVIGQQEAKQHLLKMVHEGRVPHALMITGQEGSGAMPLALALARHLLCEHPREDGPCQTCASCRMTADWAHLPYDFMAKVSNEIINKVKGVNRVCYDISSKPPSTIEWE